MKIISIFLILCIIQVSLCGWFDSGVQSSTSEVIVNNSEEDTFGESQKLQSDAEADAEDELGTNDQNPDIANQDDDSDGAKPDQSEANEPTPSILLPDAPQPSVDQNKGSSDNLPPPDYSAVNVRGYLPACHGGQYQCQKTDPTIPTRCIPQEWRCNGMRDCENNDDESGCSTDQLSRGRTQAKCTQEQYQCHGSGINSVPPHCIERRFVCDGTYHCSYGDDEANCGGTDRRDERRDDRRDDRRDTPNYPNQIPRRHENNSPNTNEQNSGNRADPRDAYRPQQPAQNDRKSEEYVQRLEWRDRCFRSCLKY